MPPDTPIKKPVILIVDDTPKNIQIVGSILRKSIQCEFAFATNGKQALETLKGITPDLILLDVMMPEMDGYEVCSRLKADVDTKDIPVIFLTAKTETDDIVMGFEKGAVDYVTKPFNPAELLARVNTQLKLKERNDTIARINNEQKEMLHVLCHDLANPVGTAAGLLELAREQPEIFEELAGDITIVLNNALQIISLVRKMRALAEGKIAINMDPVNLKYALDKSMLILKGKFEEKRITLNVKIPEDLHVLAEATSLINSVLNNILTNAVKFSYPGSSIEITATELAGKVILSVRDHGIGMPERLLNDVFSINKPTSRPGTNGESGTGFGMPLMKRFVNAYGGDIVVHSQDKKTYPDAHGTEVVVTMDKCPPP